MTDAIVSAGAAGKAATLVWVVMATGLVLLMQAGFATYQAGLTRPKNAINVAVTRLSDVVAVALIFWMVGFGLMYGAGGPVVGTTSFFVRDDIGGEGLAQFVLALFGCSIALAVFAGAIAERMTFKGYLVVALLFGAGVYPIFGHWVWGGGWLSRRGFVDYGGATVIHSLGGWLALAALLAVGNRTGRYSRSGKAIKLPGSSVPLSALGTMILWFGWLAWLGAQVPDLRMLGGVLTNAILAAAGGGLCAMGLGYALVRVIELEPILKGSLAGLVAVSAACDKVSPPLALILGVGGGAAMIGADRLLERLRIDDAVGAVPTHLAAGLWGTLAAALFGKADLGAQLVGVGACAAWGFGLSFVLLKGLSIPFKLRVSRDEEFSGLNVSEHQASTELMDLMDALEETARQETTGATSVYEPFSEIAQIAFDAEGVISYCNPAVSAIFGYDERELKKTTITQLFSPTDEEPTIDLAWVRQTFGVDAKEAVGLRRTGETFPAEVSLGFAGVAGSDEQVEAITFKDITVRKEKEAGLSRTQAEIRRQLDKEIEASKKITKGSELPREHELPGGEIAMSVASGDAGDWFGYYYDAEGQAITLYAGDITGQAGTTAALLAAVDADNAYGQDYTHGLLLGDVRYPAERQLRNLGDVVNRVVSQAGRGEMLVSMSFVHIDLQTGDVTFLSAGRTTPMLIKSGRTLRELGGGGTPLGNAGDPDFDFKKLSIASGDVIVMYSDGLVDAFAPDGSVLHGKELKKLVGARDHVKDIRDQILARAKDVWKERAQEHHSVLAFKWTPRGV